MEITHLCGFELVPLIRAGKLSVREVVEAHIRRIEKINPKLNALVIPLFEQARKDADKLDHEMKDLSESEIKAIFLKKLIFTNDTKLVPINLEARDPLRLNFEKKVLNMSFQRLKSYWTKQHYLGHRPPVSMKSQESIKAFVKKVKGSIGYIKADRVDDSVKVMYRWSD